MIPGGQNERETEESTPPGRRTARAILLDAEGRLILIRRNEPGRRPSWTLPGGGVEPADASVEAALRRELAEELGAEIADATQVFMTSSPDPDGAGSEYVYAARLVRMDESARSGPEPAAPSRGEYGVDRVDLLGDALASLDLRPAALKEFILAHRHSLLRTTGVRPADHGTATLELPSPGSLSAANHRHAGRDRRPGPAAAAPPGPGRRRPDRSRRLPRPWAGRVRRAVHPRPRDELLLRINADGYDPGDLDRLVFLLGLPCDQPDPPLVTPRRLAMRHPDSCRGTRPTRSGPPST